MKKRQYEFLLFLTVISPLLIILIELILFEINPLVRLANERSNLPTLNARWLYWGIIGCARACVLRFPFPLSSLSCQNRNSSVF
jgi:hypothetical protein